jgi:hypothetical protein
MGKPTNAQPLAIDAHVEVLLVFRATEGVGWLTQRSGW